jgi:transcriptional regulator with XRE-family HTH domain
VLTALVVALAQRGSRPRSVRAERAAQLFGERLRELRDKRGETTPIPRRTRGMSYTYLSDLERGIKTPTLATIVRLALALRCKVTDWVAVFNKHDLATLVPRRK